MSQDFQERLNDIMSNSVISNFEESTSQMKTPKLPSRREYSISKQELIQSFPVIFPQDVEVSEDDNQRRNDEKTVNLLAQARELAEM